MLVAIFFFFYGSAVHRDLHSFPTRRSPISTVGCGASPYSAGSTSTPPVSNTPRSEEHTSELQSHSDLVCRLLLEKKKISRFRAVDPAWPKRLADADHFSMALVPAGSQARDR